MDIVKINHVAILTDKVQETVDFYEKILGFHLKETICDSSNCRHLFLNNNGTFEIELIEGASVCNDKMAFSHLALDVKSVNETIQELEKKGISILEHAVLKMFNTHMISIKDPNGIVIALRENIV